MSRFRGLVGLNSMSLRLLRAGATAFGVIVSVGCAVGVSPDPLRLPVGSALPPAHRIVGVPFVPGDPGACGPAALASVLGYWGDPVTVSDIANAVSAPSLAGVLPMDLARFAATRASGLAVRAEAGTLAWLRARVADDHPVIAFLDLGFGPVRQGHFVVVVGYDDADERVLLYSGRDAGATMSYRRFASSWGRGGWWALAPTERRDSAVAPGS
ncbi:MAG TPA: C39 family peptidase [Nitrospiria bacterium]|nr:C39 family peptidase [Nitrospiria bacterium]